jgi:hypothetical protein
MKLRNSLYVLFPQKLILRGLDSVVSISILFLSCSPRNSSKCPPESRRRSGTLELDPPSDPPTRLPITVRIEGLTSLGAWYEFRRHFLGDDDGGACAGCAGCCGCVELEASSPLSRFCELLDGRPLSLLYMFAGADKPKFVVGIPVLKSVGADTWVTVFQHNITHRDDFFYRQEDIPLPKLNRSAKGFFTRRYGGCITMEFLSLPALRAYQISFQKRLVECNCVGNKLSFGRYIALQESPKASSCLFQE